MGDRQSALSIAAMAMLGGLGLQQYTAALHPIFTVQASDEHERPDLGVKRSCLAKALEGK